MQIKNNIISNATSSFKNKGLLSFDVYPCNYEREIVMITALNNNAFYRTSSVKPVNAVVWSPVGPSCYDFYPSFAGFKTAVGFMQNSIVIENQAENSFFVNADKGYFRLKAKSPAIRAGEVLPDSIATLLKLPVGHTRWLLVRFKLQFGVN